MPTTFPDAWRDHSCTVHVDARMTERAMTMRRAAMAAAIGKP